MKNEVVCVWICRGNFILKNMQDKDWVCLLNLEGEIWKDIEGYENIYKISNKGRIKSLSKKRVSKNGKITYTKEKLIGLGKKVILTKNSIESSFDVNKLHDKYFFSRVDLDGEIWVELKGFEKFYMVSNLGRVKSLCRFIKKSNNRTMFFQEKIINQTKHSKNGYYSVALNDGVISKRINVHRLVALHFVPLVKDKIEVNHIDSDKSNNRFDNLEWVSRSENQTHMAKNKPKTSIYSGVCRAKSGMYKSYFRHKNLGSFKTELEAYEARKKCELENNIINKYS